MPSFIKQLMLDEITREFETNPYAFISSFQGLSVADMSELRRNLEKVSKRSLVVKHSMAKKVFSKYSWNDAETFLQSSVLVTLGEKEPQVICKVLMDFAKTNEKLIPRGMIFEKKVYDRMFVKVLSELPSRKELLTQVAVRVKSPIYGFVITLNQVLKGFAVALNEIRKKKETVTA